MPERAAVRAALAVSLAALVGACASPTECEPGALQYTGRPPARLFSYEETCRADCFSAARGCGEDCGLVQVEAPTGELSRESRRLVLMDQGSLTTDPDEPLALVYSFEYIDLAEGEAPVGWDFLGAGPREYLAGRVDGTARFVMTGAVHELIGDDDAPFLGAAASTPLVVQVGRLRIDVAESTRLAGRFFLGWESELGQPQGEVQGCFDLSVAEPASAGATVRRLGP